MSFILSIIKFYTAVGALVKLAVFGRIASRAAEGVVSYPTPWVRLAISFRLLRLALQTGRVPPDFARRTLPPNATGHNL
jgi:hypothetical protein